MHWEEAIRIYKGVRIFFVEFKSLVNVKQEALYNEYSRNLRTNSAPKFGIVAAGYHSAFGIRTQNALNGVECIDNLMTECTIKPVLGRSLQSDNEDVALTLERDVLECRKRHF
jgi:hypothetical protein